MTRPPEESTEPTVSAAHAAPGTRWGRFALASGAGLGIAGVVIAMTMQGLLAASFAVSGDSFQLTASQFTGDGFTQYGDVASPVQEPDVPVALASIDSATLEDLCLSAVMDLPIGAATLEITAGANEPVRGENMVLDIENMQGDAAFDAIEIGRDASTLDRAQGGSGPVGGFGLQADEIRVSGMEVTSWAVTSGTMNLSGLDMRVRPGEKECS